MKVHFIIKNKVSEENFEEIVYDWLSDGDYTPDDIIENIITEHNLELFPVHYYNCSYTGEVSASLGYTHEESYWVYNPETKRQEKRTKTVTTWRPHFEKVNGKVGTVLYMGESRFDFLRPFIESTRWSKNELVKIDDDAGHQLAKKYKKDLTQAWNETGINESYRKATNYIKNNLPSTLVNNFKANLKFNVFARGSAMIPFWIFMYDYKGKKYYVSVDGNNPDRIDGKKPENKKRKYTVIAVRWIGWLSTIFLAWTGAGILFEEANNSNYRGYREWIALGGFIVLFAILGFIIERIVKNIKTESKQRRQEKLAKMRANKLLKKD